MSDAPEIHYAPSKCPACGARNLIEANSLCRPGSDETGERSCPSTDCPETPDGQFMFPTAESLAALDAWIDEMDQEN